MNRLEKAIAAVAPSWAASRARNRAALAYYEAAKPNRLQKQRRSTGSGDVTVLAARRNLRGKFVLVPAPQPVGALRGRILAPDTGGTRGIRLNLDGTRFTTTTDRSGAFTFPALPVGTYTVVASGTGFHPLQITGVTIEPGRTFTLDPQTLRPASDLTRLEAVVVLGTSNRLRPFDRGQRSDAPRIAARLLTTTIPFAVLLPSDLAPRVPDADQFDGQPDLHAPYTSAGKIMFLDSD
jgi:hypothetical protein